MSFGNDNHLFSLKGKRDHCTSTQATKRLFCKKKKRIGRHLTHDHDLSTTFKTPGQNQLDIESVCVRDCMY